MKQVATMEVAKAPEVWTEDMLLDRLHAKFSGVGRPGAPQWVSFSQLRADPSYDTRTIDFWAMNCWPSSGFLSVAAEVKVSRGDWLREIKDTQKRASWKALVNQFYFCAPKDIIKPAEVPEGYGLLVPRGAGLGCVIQPRLNEDAKPDWSFVACVARRVLEHETDASRKLGNVAEIQGKPLTYEALCSLAGKLDSRVRHWELREQIRKEFDEERERDRKAGREWREREGRILGQILELFGDRYFGCHNDEALAKLMVKIRRAASLAQVADVPSKLRAAADLLEGKP